MPQGKLDPSIVLDDGLTTRQRRLLPVTAVFTGDGKGKSTSAFGMALRAWNHGLRIGVFQFVKSPKWRVGEETAMRRLGELTDPPLIEWNKMGEGWSWARKQGSDTDHARDAREGWEEVKRRLAAETHDFYILDEFTYPISWGWVDCDDVVESLTHRPGTQHVVITGRRAPQALIDAADLVTEMRKVKHPMDVGRKGQKGIEW